MSRAPQQRSLLILSNDFTASHQLAGEGSYIIGRDNSADIIVHDSSLSRRHAELTVSPSGISIADCGSLNGTAVGNDVLEPNRPRRVEPGEMLLLGNVSIVVQQHSIAIDTRHRWQHTSFEIRLAEECDRCHLQSKSLALVRVHIDPNAPDLEQTVLSALGPCDIVGDFGPDDIEIILIDRSHEEIEATLTLLRELVKVNTGKHAEIAAAVLPYDGQKPAQLMSSVADKIRVHRARKTTQTPRLMHTTVTAQSSDDAEVIRDPQMKGLYQMARRAASGSINVLIQGETGVGKEVLARWIHTNSPRANRPLVSLNCAAIAHSLLEAELFGHVKGSFSGAEEDKPGLFETANGGSVFLDEVGDMPLELQSKLLRVLEDGKVRRIGDVESRQIDVRFIAATHIDLEKAIVEGRFRQDLYYRINGIAFVVPPLRDRPSEIAPLAKLFIRVICERDGRSPIPDLSESAQVALNGYSWPGNIRELRNTLERAIVLCGGDILDVAHLPAEKFGGNVQSRLANGTAVGPGNDGLLALLQQEAPDLVASPIKERIEAIERASMIHALQQTDGHRGRAAELIGMPRRTFGKRCLEYGLRLSDE